ncbi:crosslink repair DNA glycosylase YcaQ family protein [Streptomyces sp. PH10-H1]|uniref:DNA glycosylase AlkZ-like family protein n=1 Tax=Streptomyces sp. PH10-H1 TaxID=3046212 RepID=UPI0024B9C8E5|nr:crosslink repair DNA glycosylase YcaQ family protein [Streptomyces sp. PH10-H1]MDJ0345593.1 crosslink repair DNA glycosylase YcaQ family protein [Streptomyces sp. PH10-H1]
MHQPPPLAAGAAARRRTPRARRSRPRLSVRVRAATPATFAKWLAAPGRWAAELFDSLAGELQQVDFDGATAWVVAGDTVFPAAEPRGVRLLPYFDAYVVACQPRERLYPGRAAERALTPGGQAGNHPVLLVDGTVAGVWHQRRSGRRLDITVETLRPLTVPQLGELDGQAGRIGEILEGTPRLTIGDVPVGAHA